MTSVKTGLMTLAVVALCAAAWAEPPAPPAKKTQKPPAFGQPSPASKAAPALDSTGPRGDRHKGGPDLQARIERWKSLPPEEREKLMARYKAFEKLPDDKKRAIRERMEQWHTMTPDQRRQMTERWKEYHSMPPDMNERMRQRLATWRAMPPEEQLRVRRALSVIKSLPKEEVVRIKALPPDQRRAAIDKLLAAKGVSLDGIRRMRGMGGPGGPDREMRDRRGMRLDSSAVMPGAPDDRQRGDRRGGDRRRPGERSDQSTDAR